MGIIRIFICKWENWNIWKLSVEFKGIYWVVVGEGSLKLGLLGLWVFSLVLLGKFGLFIVWEGLCCMCELGGFIMGVGCGDLVFGEFGSGSGF